MTNSTKATKTCQEMSFEELLIDISSHFINLSCEAIDKTIEDAQRRVCQCLDIDLSALWQWSADKAPHFMTISHLFAPSFGPEKPEGIDASISFPWIYNKILHGEPLYIVTDLLPPEAHLDKESREGFGVTSSIAIPLTIAGSILGILTFDSLQSEKLLQETNIPRLKLVAEIFANALARQKTERERFETQERFSLAAESADAGIWDIDFKSLNVWTTESTNSIFGYAPQEQVTMERYEKSIHPDDLEKVQGAISDSITTGKKLKIEYRIISHPDGVKWVCSIGRSLLNPSGAPQRMLGLSVDITERKTLEGKLQQRFEEIEKLKQQLQQENQYLRNDLKGEKGFEHVIGANHEFKEILSLVHQVAATPATILLLGETGTGKGVIANLIHQLSDRKDQPFVTVNCAALPRELIENELFGRTKGAFTGADSAQAGRFEIANNGTIFLDEIGELEPDIQAKLLRVLQDGEFEKLGSSRTQKVDVRIIAATARHLKEDVHNGLFREDLFYRLNVFPLTLPPLRQRKDDIPLLVQFFMEKYNRKMGRKVDSISKDNLSKMTSYHWPGNIRELEHVVERGIIISGGNTLMVTDLFSTLPVYHENRSCLKDFSSNERDNINQALKLTNWRIEGPKGAAAILKIHPSTLRFKLKKLGISRPR